MTVSVEASARFLARRGERARAERERCAAETRAKVEAALLASLPAGARAWLMGSLVWGGFGERSDVDVVVSGVNANEATLIEDSVARAAQREVDLLHFEELPKDFQSRIEREGVIVRVQ